MCVHYIFIIYVTIEAVSVTKHWENISKTLIKPNSGEIKPNGTGIKPNGPEIKPNGTQIKPNSHEINSNDPRTKPDGPEIKPNSSTVSKTISAKQLTSPNVLIIGSTSFLGSRIALGLHHMGYQVTLRDDLISLSLEPMTWYRRDKLVENGLIPKYVNFTDDKIVKSLIRQHKKVL